MGEYTWQSAAEHLSWKPWPITVPITGGPSGGINMATKKEQSPSLPFIHSHIKKAIKLIHITYQGWHCYREQMEQLYEHACRN